VSCSRYLQTKNAVAAVSERKEDAAATALTLQGESGSCLCSTCSRPADGNEDGGRFGWYGDRAQILTAREGSAGLRRGVRRVTSVPCLAQGSCNQRSWTGPPSWRLSNTLDASFCIEALEEALERFEAPRVLGTDQGAQFTSEGFTSVLAGHGVLISMDGRGRWLDNVFIERLWRSAKHEEVYLKAYENLSEARRELAA